MRKIGRFGLESPHVEHERLRPERDDVGSRVRAFVFDLALKQHFKWAEERFDHFVRAMDLQPGMKIVDLGGGTGDFFYKFGRKIAHLGCQLAVADICEPALAIARSRGLNTISMKEDCVEFDDRDFDIVFCNSVIEHVTLPKHEVWQCYDDATFSTKSFSRQREFANAIRRMADGYFVQTPHRDFIIEAHTWYPRWVARRSRRSFIKILTLTNRFWVQKTIPDFNLLDEHQMRDLFPDADCIFVNRKLGFKKEIIAYKRPRSR